MTTAAPAEFYDTILADPEALGLIPLEQSPWLPLYRAAAALIPAHMSLADLGCGTGRFAKLLNRPDYIGIDFSVAAINEATRYADGFGTFIVGDLRDIPLPDAGTFVLLEVLEHLEEDIALLRRIPVGALVVLSVPSYESEAHLRQFEAPGSALDRYEDVLELCQWQRIRLRLRHDRYWHLISGYAKGQP